MQANESSYDGLRISLIKFSMEYETRSKSNLARTTVPQQIPRVEVSSMLAQIRPGYFYHHSIGTKNLHICNITSEHGYHTIQKGNSH